MNFSCLFFDDDGEVCFAEALTVQSLADAVLRAQQALRLHPAFSWYEVWLDGDRIASSHDDDGKRPAPSKSRGLLN